MSLAVRKPSQTEPVLASPATNGVHGKVRLSTASTSQASTSQDSTYTADPDTDSPSPAVSSPAVSAQPELEREKRTESMPRWMLLLHDYHAWILLASSGLVIFLGIVFLETEQRSVLFSAAFDWFPRGEDMEAAQLIGSPLNRIEAIDPSRSLGFSSLLLLGAGMVLAAVGWLQDFWGDVKSRLISRPMLVALALLLSLVALALVRTKAEEVLLVALSLGWVVSGIFHRFIGKARVLVGRSVNRLSPSAGSVCCLYSSKLSALNGNKDAADSPDKSYLNVSELEIGDIVRLREGELIPCDGQIIDGPAIIREVRFSPLGRSVNRCKGDRLYAGSRVISGVIDLKIEEVFGDSDLAMNLSKLDNSLNEPIDQDLKDYRLQRLMIVAGCLTSILIAACHYLWYSSLSAACGIFGAILLALVVVSVPTFFFPIRRLCILRAFKKGAFVAKASAIAALSGIKHIVVDMVKGDDIVYCDLRSLKIFDDSLNSKAVLDLILALLARIDLKAAGHGEGFWNSLHDAIRDDSKFGMGGKSSKPVMLDNFSFSSRGVQAVFEGIPVYLGEVQFLLENNVVIDVADVSYCSHPERLLLLAMGREVIAAMSVVPTSLAIEPSDLKRLREWGFRVSLISDAERKEVDLQGKGTGFDLGSIHGGLSGAAIEEKLRTMPPAAIFSSRGLKRDLGFLVAPFDELRREFEDGEVIVISRSIRPFVELLNYISHSAQLRRYLLWSGIAVSGVASALILLFPQLLWVGIALGGCFHLMSYLYLYYLTPRL